MARALILDSEAVAALAQRRQGMAERLAAAQEADHRVVIPTVVLAEVATGALTDAAIWHVLGKIPTVDLPESVEMRAGTLRSRAERTRRKKRDLTVDAIVAATAVELAPSVVLTADRSDLELLTDGFDVKVSPV
ncbi:type II toxin-antitoxin system VapC family toxin [Flexivirga oryzae]|uniref:Putative nucleic acid-binding protein n=1 Tax=Flexivirga oryzae TaxID=1794944 RepID=A0A839NC84_9MICO|nr:PIN domain-containing protein [Flexivirga oryzae]MBB2893574.1 putative nucleic acid-binding protein [Flexivirga oryzae]